MDKREQKTGVHNHCKSMVCRVMEKERSAEMEMTKKFNMPNEKFNTDKLFNCVICLITK